MDRRAAVLKIQLVPCLAFKKEACICQSSFLERQHLEGNQTELQSGLWWDKGDLRW